MTEVKFTSPVGLTNRGRLGFLLKDSVIYGGAAAFSKAISLVTFPLLARHFSIADYGVLDYFMVLASFLTIMFIFGQDSAVARYFYEHEDPCVRSQLISQSLVFQLVGLGLLLPFLWFGGDWLVKLLINVPGSVRLFKIILLHLPFLLVINFSQNLLKWTFARASFLTMSLGFTLVQASLLITAVLVFDTTIEGVLLVSLTTSFVFGVLGLFFVRHWPIWPSNFRRLREMLIYAIPYGVICVLGAFSPALERSLTSQILGAKNVGLYAAGCKIAMLIGLVVSAFQTAWGPFSMSIYKQADAVKTYNWVLKLFVMGMSVMVFALTLLAHPIIHLLATDRYANAEVVVFPLAMGLAIQATSWITEIGIGISKRSYLNLYSYIFALANTLAGILLLAPIFGLFGVAMGVMLGHVVKAIISSWLAQRAYPLDWNYTSVVIVFCMTLITGFFATLIEHYVNYQAYIMVLGAGLLAVLGLGWGVLLNSIERQRLISVVRTRLNSLATRF